MAKKEKAEFEGNLPVEEADKIGENEIIEIQPEASEYKGAYRCKRDDRLYALAIKDDPIRGRTHHARNTGFFWEGTKAEFEDQFVKE